MDFDQLKTALSRTRMQRNVLGGAGVILLAANVLLALDINARSNQVILVPTNVSDGMVARGAFDKRYVESLALDAIYGLYNATPANTSYGRDVISRLSSVKDRNTLLSMYDDVSEDMKEREISTVFYPRQIEHNLDKLEVVVVGDLQTFVNTVPITSEPRRILLGFVPEAGSIRLSFINNLEVES